MFRRIPPPPNKPGQGAAILVSLLLLPAVGACTLPGRGDPLKKPAFLTPIAEAQQAGLTPYWLGPQFYARGVSFGVDGEASFGSAQGPTLLIGYSARLGPAYSARLGPGGSLLVTTVGSGGAFADTLRQHAKNIGGGQGEPISVGRWQGELYRIPSASRPVASMELFLDVGDITVIADADAGSSGIPGKDDNVLLDKDTLVATVAALRPYPQ